MMHQERSLFFGPYKEYHEGLRWAKTIDRYQHNLLSPDSSKQSIGVTSTLHLDPLAVIAVLRTLGPRDNHSFANTQ